MKAGYIQNSPHFGQKERNFDQVAGLARGVKADLLVLPELFATGYTFTSQEEVARLAEPADGETAAFLRKLSLQTGAVLVAGFAEEDQGKVYNSAMMIAGDRLIGTYRKIHLFNREKLWFAPGNRQPLVYDVGGIRIGMMICFDWFFPEIARTLAIKMAQVIAHPSNLVMPYCQGSMPTRCLENRVYAITANRIGEEKRGTDHFLFTGASQITALNGDILSSAPVGETYAAVVDFDNYLADNKMINDYNDIINDRKPNLYF